MILSQKRISKYAKLEIIDVEDEKIPSSLSSMDMENIKEKESNKIINKLEKYRFNHYTISEHNKNKLEKFIKDTKITNNEFEELIKISVTPVFIMQSACLIISIFWCLSLYLFSNSLCSPKSACLDAFI